MGPKTKSLPLTIPTTQPPLVMYKPIAMPKYWFSGATKQSNKVKTNWSPILASVDSHACPMRSGLLLLILLFLPRLPLPIIIDERAFKRLQLFNPCDHVFRCDELLEFFCCLPESLVAGRHIENE